MIARSFRSSHRLGRSLFEVLSALGGARIDPATTTGDRAERLSAIFQRLCAVHRFETQVAGDLPAGPCVLVANHLSYLDPVLIASAVPCAPVAKGEVGRWPVIGDGAKQFGVILVEREDLGSRVVALRRALRALRTGTAVLNFPEGTTTDGSGELLPFQRGIFGIALRAKVPVIPIGVDFGQADLTWTGDATFMPHYWRTAGRPDTRITLRFGKPICTTAGFQNAHELAEYARERVNRLRRNPPHEPTERLRIPQTWTDPVFPTARANG